LKFLPTLIAPENFPQINSDKFMTRQIHDQFTKEYLVELLSPFGQVEKDKKVQSERQEIDIFFTPNPNSEQNLSNLGILSKFAQNTCLIEPYRNPCTEIEIKSCLLKLLAMQTDQVRGKKRNKNKSSPLKYTNLWILTPTCSETILKGFGAELGENEGEGIYFLADFFQTAIVVIHQLPVNEDTLWLRLLGKGTTQKQAIAELVNLPQENPYRRNLLEILADWRKSLELRDNKTTEDEEDVMNLSQAYLQDREQWLQEGRLEGRLEGQLEGRLEGQLETIPLLTRLGLTVEQISQELNLDIEVINRYLNRNQN
jgi:hypothetical protein